jgi:uncharacterized protein (TIGR03382 family)
MCFELFRALLAAAFVPAFASAFTLLPSAGIDGARWRDFPVLFNTSYANAPFAREEVEAIVSEALAMWNGVPGAKLSAGPGQESLATARQLLDGAAGETAIVFDTDFAATLGGTDESVVAVATSVREGDTYIQGIVVVNAGSAAFNGEEVTRAEARLTLTTVIAHEAGHTFGLGHSSDERALMYPTVRRLDGLGDDDRMGITYLYPEKEMVDGGPFGCAAVGEGGRPPGPGGFVAVVVLFGLSWFFARRPAAFRKR